MKDKLQAMLLQEGACDVGFSHLPDAPLQLKNSLSVAVRLSDAVVEEITGRPTHSYFHHYRTVNFMIDQLILKAGILLQKEGYRYLPVAASQSINLGNGPYDGRYSHKKAACMAGMGFIGKSSLFIHRQYGPRVRLGTLFTDCDFKTEPTTPKSLCGSCTLCQDACPSGAILGGEYHCGIKREEIFNPKLCSDHMKKAYQMIGRGAVCGICMRVCPFGIQAASGKL